MQTETTNVYIVLSRSKTVLARVIQIITRKKYNHSSLALDESCDTFYSFGRLYPRLLLPAGFITEGADKGFFEVHPDCPCAVYEVPLTAQQHALVRERLAPFIAQPEKHKYSIIGLFYQYFQIVRKQDDNYVCAAFIAQMLDGMIDMGKHYSLVYPHEFQEIGLECIFEGIIGDYTEHYNKKVAAQAHSATCEEAK